MSGSEAKISTSPQSEGWRWERPSYLYFLRNVAQQVADVVKRRPILFGSAFTLLLVTTYAYRYAFQPYAVVLRIYADAIVFTILSFFAISYVLRRWLESWKKLRMMASVLGTCTLVFLAWAGRDAHRYLGQYWRYKTLDLVELDRMPTTGHERVLPRDGVETLVRSLRDQTEWVSEPTFVKTKGGGYCWSMAIEPDRAWQTWNDPVDEVICIPGGEATPNLTKRGQIPVRFEVGENLLFSRNVSTCARRALGPIRFFTYEPERPFVAQRDDGTWVWIVPWVKWVGTFGIFFPRPEFGGVQIIEQSPQHPLYRRWLWESPKRVLAGCGEWVPAWDVHKHAFLRGQNLMPDSVSRSYGESFRFQDWILGPLRWFKSGDVRIADSAGGVNRLPYTSFYVMPFPHRNADKLYDSIALEPNDEEKRTLVTSLFVPADGIGPSYVYRHSRRNEAPMGITAVPSQVQALSPDIYWANRRVVEHRYYIRDLPDSTGKVERRLMYLSIVVLIEKDKDGKETKDVIQGAIPLIVITDSDTKAIVWVDPHKPESWDEKIREKFGPLWSKRT